LRSCARTLKRALFGGGILEAPSGISPIFPRQPLVQRTPSGLWNTLLFVASFRLLGSLVGLVGSACFLRPRIQGIETIHLHRMRHAISRERAGTFSLRHLRGGAPIRPAAGADLDHASQTHTNTFREYEKDIIGIGSTPAFAIGQRALLVRTDNGNILWDCIATFDDATVTMIEALGGIDAIAISHPHFYTTMVEWARAFSARIHLHAADKQ
jgi:hypothetical protein